MSDSAVAIFAVSSPYAWDVWESVTRQGHDVVALDNFGGADPRLPLAPIDSASRDDFVIGLSSAHARAIAAYDSARRGFDRPISVADPSAVVASTVELRHGSYLNAGVVIGSHAVIGCHANVNRASSIGHDSSLGFAASIAPGVTLAGGVTVATRAFVGAGATVLPGVTVGRGAVVGAGAIVTQDVPPGALVIGNPARIASTSAIDWDEESVCPHCSRP